MKKVSYNLLAIILIFSMIALPLLANNPFEVNIIKVDESATKDDYADTAETQVNNVSAAKSASDKNFKEQEGVITAEALNVRSTPWGDIIGTLKKGDKIVIIGIIGDWYKIKYNGKDGYIHANWVTTKDKKGMTKPQYGVVTRCYWLNVRRVPSGDILGELKAGEKVYILGQVGEWYKIRYNGNEAFVSKKYIDLTTDGTSSSTSSGNSSNFSSFTGYCTASALNVRTGAWGTVVGYLYKGDSIKITGEDGDWYKGSFGGTTRYVSKKYISKTKPSGSSSTSSSYSGSSRSSGNTGNAVSASDGSLQQNIVKCARALVGSTNFRGSDVSGGRLACAKVATTALKNAGALDSVVLNCRSAVKNLKAKGWKEVSAPPYQEGDVVTWKTYDYTGDGVKDEDTHIGIILKEGNSYKAMNNSSSLRTPRITDINIAPISRVLRKC